MNRGQLGHSGAKMRENRRLQTQQAKHFHIESKSLSRFHRYL